MPRCPHLLQVQVAVSLFNVAWDGIHSNKRRVSRICIVCKIKLKKPDWINSKFRPAPAFHVKSFWNRSRKRSWLPYSAALIRLLYENQTQPSQNKQTRTEWKGKHKFDSCRYWKWGRQEAKYYYFSHTFVNITGNSGTVIYAPAWK